MTIIRSDSDIQAALQALIELDPRLQAIVHAAGPVPLRLQEPGFAGLASIVVSQMISRASAEAIWRRIIAAGPVTAKDYVELEPDVIATFGLSRAKAATLLNLARAVSQGRFDPQAVCALDTAEAVGQLTTLSGIGPWTAQVYLMFCGGHADIFPVGDVALQAAVGHGFAMVSRPSAKELLKIAELWRPWRSVAARLFWAYYAAEMHRNVTPLA
ncbi:DNA-3-methyladenine glycosylase 2 family protein [Rhizobium deserti]|uniref:DNA-3-methyladenine glycosylase II n=1 Tax=Rhizobium deserti TaxID=2547961 RepID=A0A4R5UGC8_9HYPH|nr:DNA-3-methyladenine glycosylase [Rhizobium deserti]TDK34583.1 DNA-3-methyladenine glycosylase 2 family protein [Rhizobium deserti]